MILFENDFHHLVVRVIHNCVVTVILKSERLRSIVLSAGFQSSHSCHKSHLLLVCNVLESLRLYLDMVVG